MFTIFSSYVLVVCYLSVGGGIAADNARPKLACRPVVATLEARPVNHISLTRDYKECNKPVFRTNLKVFSHYQDILLIIL